MGKLDGKVVVITGAGSGLGKQFAIRMANEGAKLAICTKNAQRLEITKRNVRLPAQRSWPTPAMSQSMTSW